MSSQRAEQLASIAVIAILYLAWFGCDIGGHHYGVDLLSIRALVDGAP